jgi:hypothetical protein
MVNPYLVNPGSRPALKTGIQLNQSQAMKKFEKIQAKNSMSQDRRSNSFTGARKSHQASDQSDDQSDDSLFKNAKKNANKFMKKKQAETLEQSEDEEDESDDEQDIEISINERNASRLSKSPRQQIKNRSATSSVSSLHTIEYQPPTVTSQQSHRRSQSKVKFVANDINEYLSDKDQSSIVEDLLSRNLVFDIDDLEPVSNYKVTAKKKLSKSPTLIKRSESVASIIEEKENSDYSDLTPSIASPSLLETNLILDINELEKNVAKKSKNEDLKGKKSGPGSDSGSETTKQRSSSSTETSSSEAESKSNRLSDKKSTKKKKKKDREKDKEREKEKEKRKKEKEKEKEKKRKEKEKEKVIFFLKNKKFFYDSMLYLSSSLFF